MHSFLITGANRGIGLEVVKQFLAHRTEHPKMLIATVRDIPSSKALLDIIKSDLRVHIMKLDLNDYDSFPEFAREVGRVVGNEGLTVLFNNAAILENKTGTLETAVNAEMLTKQFKTNTIAPILLTKALLPLLKKSAMWHHKEKIGIKRAAIIYMSSSLGSISKNEQDYSGGYWGYRESKAALNMAARTITAEVKSENIATLVIHPGWVRTQMGGVEADLRPETSAEGILKILLALDEKTSGKFLDYTGKVLNW